MVGNQLVVLGSSPAVVDGDTLRRRGKRTGQHYGCATQIIFPKSGYHKLPIMHLLLQAEGIWGGRQLGRSVKGRGRSLRSIF